MLGPWTPERTSPVAATHGPARAVGGVAPTVDPWPIEETVRRATAFSKIAVAVDGSAASMRAFELALGLAKTFRSSLGLVTVVPTPPAYGLPFFAPETWQAITKAYSDELAKLEVRARRSGIVEVAAECREGLVVDQILDYLAAHPPDLLVVGARGLSVSRRLVLGSVSDALVHHAECPVLVVRDVVRPGR